MFLNVPDFLASLPSYDMAEKRQEFINNVKVGDPVFWVVVIDSGDARVIRTWVKTVMPKTLELELEEFHKLGVEKSFNDFSDRYSKWFFGGVFTPEMKGLYAYLEASLKIQRALCFKADTEAKQGYLRLMIENYLKIKGG